MSAGQGRQLTGQTTWESSQDATESSEYSSSTKPISFSRNTITSLTSTTSSSSSLGGAKRPFNLPSRNSPGLTGAGEDEEGPTVKKKRKRVPLIQRSLAIVLSSLHGNQIVVECKDGTEISGVILEVSEAGLGMLLGAARIVDTSGDVTEHREYYLVGSAIRYVHLPPHINAAKHVNRYIFDKEAAVDLSNRPHVLIDKEKLRPSKSPSPGVVSSDG